MSDSDPLPGLPEPLPGPPATRATAANVLVFGPFRFDAAERTLWRAGSEVTLPPRALALLARLLERPGSLVSKEALVAAVWPGTFVGDAALAEAVSLLRETLGDDAQRPTYVQTVHRRGYRFVAPVVPQLPSGPQALVRREDGRGPTEPHELHEPSDANSATTATAATPVADSGRRSVLVATAGVAVLLLVAGVAWLAYKAGRDASTPAPAPRRATLLLPADARLDVPVAPALALTPAGDLLVFGARQGEQLQLWTRRLEHASASPVPGTLGAAVPFVSPDGRWIGFFAQGRMAKVPVSGGEPVTLARSPYPFGASWGEDGDILYAPDGSSGLWRVPALGGEPRPATRLDAATGELGHRWPQVLPGGKAALFTAWRGSIAKSSIEWLDLASGERRRLLAGASFPRYAAGYLVCVRGDGLVAAPLDAARGRLDGPPAAVLDGVAIQPSRGSAQLALSGDGTLVYLPAEDVDRWSLLRVGADGAVQPLPLADAAYRNVAASHDGRRLAFTAAEEDGNGLWAVESGAPGKGGAMGATGTSAGVAPVRLARGWVIEPVWSADGRTVFFAAADADGRLRLMRVAADGSAAPLLVSPPRRNGDEGDRYPVATTADGAALIFVQEDPATATDLWLLPLAGNGAAGEPRPLLRTPAHERFASVSFDGRRLAWSSNASGRLEVYVGALDVGGVAGRLQVSRDGGAQPRWSSDGRQLWYRHGDQLLVVDVGGGSPLALGVPRVVYSDPDLDRYALLPDGGAIVVGRDPRRPRPPRLELVLGWGAELARLAGTRR
jgi:eukaryotic-like serine/threonine-protein kinase